MTMRDHVLKEIEKLKDRVMVSDLSSIKCKKNDVIKTDLTVHSENRNFVVELRCEFKGDYYDPEEKEVVRKEQKGVLAQL